MPGYRSENRPESTKYKCLGWDFNLILLIIIYVMLCYSVVYPTKWYKWFQGKYLVGHKLVIGCVYRSPHSTDENNSKLNYFNYMLLNISKRRYSHVMETGDLNMPSINWKTWSATYNFESKEYKFIECLRDCYWTQNLEEITRARIDSNPGLLDLILCNSEDIVTEIENESPLGKSDHSVLVYTFRCYVKKRIFFIKEAKTMSWEVNFQVLIGIKNSVFVEMMLINNGIFFVVVLIRCRKRTFQENIFSITTEREQYMHLIKIQLQRLKKKHKLWKKFGQTKDGMVYNEYCRARKKCGDKG